MLRSTIVVGIAAIAFVSVPNAEAGDRLSCVYVGHDYLTDVDRHRSLPPTQIPYRDHCYRPAPRIARTIYQPPLAMELVPTHNPNAPVYNEPPPRFSND